MSIGQLQSFHFLALLAIIAMIVAAVIYLIRSTSASRGSRSVPQGQTTPGWYPSPDDPRLLRWHDGRQWTSHTHPLP